MPGHVISIMIINIWPPYGKWVDLCSSDSSILPSLPVIQYTSIPSYEYSVVLTCSSDLLSVLSVP